MYTVTAANKGFFSGKMEKNIFKTFHNIIINDEIHTNNGEPKLQHHHDREKTNKKRKKQKVKEQERDGNSMRKEEDAMYFDSDRQHKAKYQKRGRKPKEKRTDGGEVKYISGNGTEASSKGPKPVKTHALPRQIQGQNTF